PALTLLAGINRVTRYDLHASIDAGFDESELPDLLGLPHAAIRRSAMGTYRMVAARSGDAKQPVTSSTSHTLPANLPPEDRP
ncbi:MAG: hypothetical protein ABL994_24760, partial [Verrucomicrobiales bacterium]